MALLTEQPIVVPSTTPNYTAVSATDTIAGVDVGGAKFLHVKNAGGGADTVTIVLPGTYLTVAIPDLTVVVPATNGDRMIPIPPQAIDPATGLVTVQHSATASVTAALLSI
jgi:hypothetical protein